MAAFGGTLRLQGMPDQTNQYAIWNCSYPDGTGTCDGTVRNIASVGTPRLGAGKWGQLDLGGSRTEWMLDDTGVQGDNPLSAPCDDCAQLRPDWQTNRVVRDSAFTHSPQYSAASERPGAPPFQIDAAIGVRCARDGTP